MSLSVVIADSSVPVAVGLASSLSSGGHKAALLSSVAAESPVPEGLCAIPWNRQSLLSARTVPVAAGNFLSGVDCAVIAFDHDAFARVPAVAEASRPERAVAVSGGILDSYVAGYMHLAGEFAARFAREGKGRIVFVIVERKPLTEEERAAQYDRRNIPLSVAESAFERLAEEIAASCERSSVRVSLVKVEGDEDKDWLCSFVASPAAQRGPARWIKAGKGGLFSRF